MEARERICQHLDGLFATAPQNRAAGDLQEELLANSMEKYQDLVAGGMDKEAALRKIIAGIGNVDDLIAALPGDYAAERMFQRKTPWWRSSRSGATTAKRPRACGGPPPPCSGPSLPWCIWRC